MPWMAKGRPQGLLFSVAITITTVRWLATSRFLLSLFSWHSIFNVITFRHCFFVLIHGNTILMSSSMEIPWQYRSTTRHLCWFSFRYCMVIAFMFSIGLAVTGQLFRLFLLKDICKPIDSSKFDSVFVKCKYFFCSYKIRRMLNWVALPTKFLVLIGFLCHGCNLGVHW